jgi:hypothetical protein
VRTLWKDHARFVQAYLSTYTGCYFTGDGCRRDADGYDDDDDDDEDDDDDDVDTTPPNTL